MAVTDIDKKEHWDTPSWAAVLLLGLDLDCFLGMPFQILPLGKNLPNNYLFGETFWAPPPPASAVPFS